jgi:hypothetical protein
MTLFRIETKVALAYIRIGISAHTTYMRMCVCVYVYVFMYVHTNLHF